MAQYELAVGDQRWQVADVAANIFRRSGIGFTTLAEFVPKAAQREDLWPVFQELTSEKLARPDWIEQVIWLFRLARYSLDVHFRWFLEKEFDRMNLEQQSSSIAYLLHPERGPSSGAIDLAYFLFSRLPANSTLESLWVRWAASGSLIKDEDPSIFFKMMNKAMEAGLSQFDPIMRIFQSYCRGLARSEVISDRWSAAKVLDAAARNGYSFRHELARELDSAVGSDEWKKVPVPQEFTESFGELSDDVLQDREFIEERLLKCFEALHGEGALGT